MDNLGAGFWLIVLIMGILNLILFFKIWAMTNDVNSIKRIMKGETLANETPDDGTTKIVFITLLVVSVIIIITVATS